MELEIINYKKWCGERNRSPQNYESLKDYYSYLHDQKIKSKESTQLTAVQILLKL